MIGYRHLNVANTWPGFTPGPTVEIDTATGGFRLRRIGPDYARSGAFVGGPFTIDGNAVPWFRLRATAGPLADDEHVELFTFTSNGPAPAFALADPVPFEIPTWTRAPRDLTDVVLHDAPATSLWVGGVLRGGGSTSPHVRQLRVDYGRDTAIASLPAVFSSEPASRERLERLLALHETPLRELDAAIAGLPRLFDPAATPAGDAPSWLSWLAAWLDFDLTDRWNDAESRTRLAEAFELYGARGTIDGLRRYLRIYAGVNARISEPAKATRVWSLGEHSTLGFTTQLAAASASGAVLDATATLDASHLTRGENFGAALFEDVAHRFCVDIHCADLRLPRTLDDVRAVLDREKPAHTVYSLRLIQPRMRVGVQARVGVDTVVGGGLPRATLGTRLGAAVLAEAPVACPSDQES